MSLIKPLTHTVVTSQPDTDGRILQVLPTIHRLSTLPVARSHAPLSASHFANPLGVAEFSGYGADGWFYEAGVKGKTWGPREMIDDFSDNVTDSNRWVGLGADFSEGGIDVVAHAPFGRRLYTTYTGPVAETYDRKGSMIFTQPGGGKAALSGRMLLPGEIAGTGIENSILLGMQNVLDDNEYIFVGLVNTTTHPMAIIHGDVIAGVATVRSSQPIPAGFTEITVAIEADFTNSQYRGYFSLDPNDADYTNASWTPISVPISFPVSWPFDLVPRIHAEFPAAYVVSGEHRLSDIRVEVDGGNWSGQARATWWLETYDPANIYDAGLVSEAPNEIIVNWERDHLGNCHLALINADATNNPLLWRRWKNIGTWKDWDREDFPHWSPGWMDAAEGHIVLTRNTQGQKTGGSAATMRGEIWLFSLRWDRVMVFATDQIGKLATTYDAATGRIVREGGTWGSRRWISGKETYVPAGNYDHRRLPNTATPYVGILKNIATETVAPAITYGVNIRRLDDNNVHIAYGIQEVPTIQYGEGQYFAGVLSLSDSNSPDSIERRLFTMDPASYSPWKRSSEGWVQVGLSYNKIVWWTQADNPDENGKLLGALNQRDFSGDASYNASSSPYLPYNTWTSPDYFGGKGYNLYCQDQGTGADDEVVQVVSGWDGGSWVSILFYDLLDPAASVIRSFGHAPTSENPGTNMKAIYPASDFPRWFPFRTATTNASLDRCRNMYSGAVGQDSNSGVSDGFCVSYGRWDGIQGESFKHTAIRSVGINEGDFVLELLGYLNMPFASTLLSNALDYMPVTQNVDFGMVLLGEKSTVCKFYKRLEGNLGLAGGATIRTSLGHLVSGGHNNFSGSHSPDPGFALKTGAMIRLRVKRTGQTWEYLYFDEGLSSWVIVSTFVGPIVPLLCGVFCELRDNTGNPASVSVEWTSLRLAPSDDPIGNPYFHPILYPSIASTNLGSVAGTISLRELPISATSNNFILGDGWAFPGFMSRP